MTDILTKEEIDALINRSSDSKNDEKMDSNFAKEVIESIRFSLTERDIISEVGHISMSQAANAMSALYNRQVIITTPRVSQSSLKNILEDSEAAKLVTSIEFKDGLDGNIMLMIDVPDAIIIADLMMGNDGKDVSTTEFTDLEVSTIGKMMNQMLVSVSTTMGTMFDRKIDSFSPQVVVLDQDKNSTFTGIDNETPIVSISFEMAVDGLFNCQIIQLFTEGAVLKINDIMLNDTSVTLVDRAPKQEQENCWF